MRSKEFPKIVDVTLRDGGYLNNWDFPKELLYRFAKRIDRVGVDIVEVGYLSNDSRLYLSARCPPALLRELRARMTQVNLAAMLRPREGAISEILNSRREFLDLIRIPTDLARLSEGIAVARAVKAAGVSSCINLTSVTAYSPSEIVRGVCRLASSNSVDFIYLADSRGALNPEDVIYLVSCARREWTGRLGFHAHNNLGYAIRNSEVAVQAGCDLVDGSIDGYGLGGGNADLRGLLKVIKHRKVLPRHQGEALTQLSKSLKLPHEEKHEYLYHLSGTKNLEQEWVQPLVGRYGKSTRSLLESIPRRRYKTLDEVINVKRV